MKIGVCYFGQPRLCEHGLVSKDWFTQSDDVEIYNFFHLWQPSNQNDLTNSISRFRSRTNLGYDLDTLIDIYKPVNYIYELQKDFDINEFNLTDVKDLVYPSRVISMLYSINKTIELVNNSNLDMLIIKRSDLKLQNKIDLDLIDLDKLNMPSWRGSVIPNLMYTSNTVYVDFIAIAKLNILQSYASLYLKLHEFSREKCWVPEYLFADHIVNENLQVNEIDLGELYTNYL
jgi:hypothetical protein